MVRFTVNTSKMVEFEQNSTGTIARWPVDDGDKAFKCLQEFSSCLAALNPYANVELTGGINGQLNATYEIRSYSDVVEKIYSITDISSASRKLVAIVSNPYNGNTQTDTFEVSFTKCQKTGKDLFIWSSNPNLADREGTNQREYMLQKIISQPTWLKMLLILLVITGPIIYFILNDTLQFIALPIFFVMCFSQVLFRKPEVGDPALRNTKANAQLTAVRLNNLFNKIETNTEVYNQPEVSTTMETTQDIETAYEYGGTNDIDLGLPSATVEIENSDLVKRF